VIARGSYIQHVLHAYWDESGHAHDSGCQYLAVAGLIATVEDWNRFEVEWARALADFGVAELHMRDYAHSTGEYSAWKGDEPRRRAFMARLLKVIARVKPRILGAAMALEPWRQLTAEQRARFIDAYFPCMQECVRLSAIHADVFHETVGLTFARVSEFAGRTPQLWDVLRRSASIQGDRLGTMATDEPRTCLPLQAADLVAYEAYKAAPILHHGTPTQLRAPLQALISIDRHTWISLFDQEQLRWQAAAAEEAERAAITERDRLREARERRTPTPESHAS
jgi:hypothetical protein